MKTYTTERLFMISKIKIPLNREDGFTLIELLVVILIIGILSAIAVPVFLNQRQVANDAAVQSDVKNAASQVESWLVKNNLANGMTGEDVASLSTQKSEGVVLFLVKSSSGPMANGFKVCGYHENGKKYTSHENALVYSSSQGGIQKNTGTCGSLNSPGVPRL